MSTTPPATPEETPMTLPRRARLGLIRCQSRARLAEAKATAATTEHGRAEWSGLAADYRRSADEWRAILASLGAPMAAACEECGVAEGEDCTGDCECDCCEINRALDEDADRAEEV